MEKVDTSTHSIVFTGDELAELILHLANSNEEWSAGLLRKINIQLELEEEDL